MWFMQLYRGCCIVIQQSPNQLMTLMYIGCIFQEYETLTSGKSSLSSSLCATKELDLSVR